VSLWDLKANLRQPAGTQPLLPCRAQSFWEAWMDQPWAAPGEWESRCYGSG
jgi:hypothetical protein